jgi:hypothetical protein
MTTYYHFTGKKLRDGSPIPKIGEWLELPENVKIKACPSDMDIANGYGGLHASGHPFDALLYAPGSTLHLVHLDGELIEHGSPVDKVAARRRKIVATIDAEPLLREFARKCALSVIHLWDAPEVVKQYLTTGDDSLRAAARDAAAREAAWAARAAAREAAWAARAAAREAAARAAARAAGAAAWAALEAAAWAARDAARDARDAARDARDARDAAREQRQLFAEMVDAAFAKEAK